MRPARLSPVPSRPARATRPWWVMLGTSWLAAVVLGFFLLFDHAWRPGAVGPTQVRWPRAAPLALDRERCTLLVFAHPMCPCTRTTLGELGRIAASSAERARTVVFFLSEPDHDEWKESGSIEIAAAIPGVEILDDPEGRSARLFGARTSGHTLLYAPSGELLFEGGITESRGHSGDNAGLEALVARLRGGASTTSSTPVFGCPLFDEPELVAHAR